MNKLSLLTVTCVVLISTVGATATVSATQLGHSPFYYFDVTYNGKAVGQVFVNTANAKVPTYALVAYGLTPDTRYTFGYNASGDVHVLATANTTTAGALVVSGTFPTADVKDLQSAQFWVTETPPGDTTYYITGMALTGFQLEQDGWFVAKLGCEYSTDNGVTWHEGSYTSGIVLWSYRTVHLSDLGVPYGALVKIHVKVEGAVGGAAAKTGSQVFRFENAYPNRNWAYYSTTGTAVKNSLNFLEIYTIPE